jgi:DNA repair protein RadC
VVAALLASLYSALVKISANGAAAPRSVDGPLARAFQPVQAPLADVDQRILEQVNAFDPALEGYVGYAVSGGGKRLRPLLALLGGGATGSLGAEHIDLAVIVELIHLATLVHDDIMDDAERRRGQPTVNARWGNSLSVLLGDVLFAHALNLATNFDDTRISRTIARTATEVCSGEMIQTQRRFDLKLSREEYFRIIGMKTGSLFACAAELSAVINGAPAEVVRRLKNYGAHIGTAYQIYDDCLDIAGDEAETGKTLGTDLRKGKLTLPILTLLESASDFERERCATLVLEGKLEEVTALLQRAPAEGPAAMPAQLKIREMPESDRPREKLAARGASALSDAELIAILLRTGVEGANAIEVARQLIAEYGSLGGLSRCTVKELAKIKGIGFAKGAQLAAAFGLGQRLARENFTGKKIDTPESIYELVGTELRALHKESLRTILLDTRFHLIRIDEVSLGSVNESIAHPRDVFRPAIIHSAYAVIVVHNHPSGDPSPSQADHSLTRRLREAAELLQIKLLDHIIIGAPAKGRSAYFSFKEAGVL